jgi:hypothetical protein
MDSPLIAKAAIANGASYEVHSETSFRAFGVGPPIGLTEEPTRSPDRLGNHQIKRPTVNIHSTVYTETLSKANQRQTGNPTTPF